MGQLIGNLTNPNTALMSPGGQTQAIGSPQQVLAQANKQLQAQPSIESQMGSDVLNPKPVGQNANLPSIGKPSFLQAATSGPYGMPNAESPGLSKAGKLVTLLTSGLKGALAGRAASEQMIAQTGGRRAGGAGIGFQAGVAQPYQQAEMGQELAQKQAQTELTRQQGSMVQTPYGLLPAALAKVILPKEIQGQYGLSGKQIEAGSREAVANTQSQTQEKIHRFVPVPNVGLFDAQTRKVIPETEQGIDITQDIIDDHQLPQEFLHKRMNLQQLAAVQRSDVFANVPEMTAEGPIVVNRKTSTATPVTGPGGQRYGPTTLAAPRVIADPDNPGQTKYVSGGTAISTGSAGPTSASVVVPRKAMGAEVPTSIGDKKVAFNTMISHAEVLRQAAKALNNGDTRALNSLSNRAQSEFGDPALTNFDAIQNAYNHEVAAVIGKNHITDAEIKNGGATMPSNANYATIEKVLNSYKSLAQSKMDNLNKQKQSAIGQSQKGGTGGQEIHYKIVNGQLVKQ